MATTFDYVLTSKSTGEVYVLSEETFALILTKISRKDLQQCFFIQEDVLAKV